MITVEKLLVSSVHLGHSVKEKNPKMSPYIYGERKGIHIIDLLQTLIQTKKVCKFLRSSTRRGKKVLFIGTKAQFSSVIENCALKSNSYYVTQRWLGGMLTNWLTVKTCLEKLELLTKIENEEISKDLTKKEILSLKKKKNKLEKFFSGIKQMDKLPEIAIVVGQKHELNAIRECLKKNITLITILDTNCDPTITDFIIPANDDSLASISLILNTLNEYIY
jgi:small subunit ribosomal protein S2